MIEVDERAFREYLRRQDDVVVAYLFGSVARGRALPMSDVDVAVLLAAPDDREAMLERQLALLTDLERLTDAQVKEYFDFQPRLRVQNDALHRRIREGDFGQRKSGDLRAIEAAERIHKRLKGAARAVGSHGRLSQSDRA
jgi:predicted nucleotidyltransferase